MSVKLEMNNAPLPSEPTGLVGDSVMAKPEKPVQRCEDCGGTDFVDDSTRGDTICTACGVCLREPFISFDQEWRSFANDDDSASKSRAVAADPYLESSQTTFFQTTTTTAGGGGPMRQRSNRSQQDKNMIELIRGIDRVCQSAALLQCLSDRAKEVAKKMLEMKIRGHSNDVMVAVALYIACRSEEVCRSMKEMCQMTNVNMNDFSRCFKLARKGMETTGLSDPKQLIPRIARDIKLQDEHKLTNACQKVADLLSLEQQGKAPTTIAAASVYMVVSKLGFKNITLAAICSSAKVAEATVQNALRSTTVDISGIVDELKTGKAGK